jgi:RNA polymerase sigma factor (sigma-70 family)
MDLIVGSGWRFGSAPAFAFAADGKHVGEREDRGACDRETREPHRSVVVSHVASIGGVPIRELIARLRASDRDALGLAYHALFPSLWRLAVLRTGSSAIAEEIVHDVFLACWARRDRLAEELDLAVYLAVAVRNRTRDLGAHDRVVQRVEEAVEQAMLEPPGASQSVPAADETLVSEEFHSIYHRALLTLTDREREAALLRWEEGFTFEQIGSVLGISAVGARKVILRAQAKVQDGLAEYRPR